MPTDGVLQRGRVDIWIAAPHSVLSTDTPKSELTSLSATELQRLDRLRFTRHKHTFAAAHLLVRNVLSVYHPTKPRAWQFQCNQYGRPFVVEHDLAGRLMFNLSHTHGLVVCAVTAEHDVGIDVESIQRNVDLRVADRYFSPTETLDLMALARDQQTHRFLQLWTLKEAYIKARGMGLAIPLRDFSFRDVDTTTPHVAFNTAIDDAPSNWQFRHLRFEESHLVAVACRVAATETLRLSTHLVSKFADMALAKS